MKYSLVLLLLSANLTFGFELAIYGVGGELPYQYANDLVDTKGYYGVGSQLSVLQEYLGEFGQVNFGYVENSYWLEVQAGVFFGKKIFFLYPRIGVGSGFMTINAKRIPYTGKSYYVRQNNLDGFLKFQGTIGEYLFVEWEGKFNTIPNWNMKIGLIKKF